MAVRDLEFHFDYISPYSYLAWRQVPALMGRHELALKPRPILLAGLLDHHGHKGPGEIPPKRAYVYRDCVRRAAELEVPFNPPFSHPFRPLLSLRVTTLDMDSSTRSALITRMFDATWVEGRDVSSAEVIGSICDDVGIPNAIARAQEASVKERLRAATARAVQRGVFGVPTLIVDDELFWGTDSLPHLERFLDGRDLAADTDFASWDRVEASAVRKPPR